jgi:hypothetical protein
MGEMVGVVSDPRSDGWPSEAGLDLVEISPNADPPVCKILDLRQVQIRAAEEEERGAQEAEGHRGQGDQAPAQHRRPRLSGEDARHEVGSSRKATR